MINDILDEAKYYKLDGMVKYINDNYINVESESESVPDSIENVNNRKTTLEYFLLNCVNIDIHEFETTFNELFSLENTKLSNNFTYDIDELVVNYYWKPKRYRNELEEKIDKFLSKYVKLSIPRMGDDEPIRINNIDKLNCIFDKIHNDDMKLFRSIYKKINIEMCDLSELTNSMFNGDNNTMLKIKMSI